MKFADPHGLAKVRRYRDPLRKILIQGRSHWDHDGVPPEKRRVFEKVLQCRTAELGAEVYASDKWERIVYHTCKSRACSSCGHRATVQWQRERWVALPEVPYNGITFTMPKDFWKIFQQNRRLADALPVLAAGIMESSMRAKHGIRIGVIATLHTFNGRLEFNSHVHTMVTAGGLHEPSGTWIENAFYNRNQLTSLWRASVIRLIRTAYRVGLLKTDMTCGQLEAMLTHWEQRWWSVRIQSFESREHFLRYAGRYVRRPAIARRRILWIGQAGVTFWTKDKKLRRIVAVQYSLKEFVDFWIQQIPGRYRHAMRYFGLFAPRAVSQTTASIFAMIGQMRRPRPKRVRWADSIKRDFGWDPLLDETGNRMRWVRRLPPTTA
jgi:hypothetical protein